MSSVRSVLYIWLPCKKVYPVGLTYLAHHVHQHHPEVQQKILDLSLIPKRKRRENLLKTVGDFNPDLILFSWRDIQVFAPHEGDASLKYAFNFYYSQNPIKRIGASLKGLQFLLSYYKGIRENLSYPWQIHRHFPEKKMMIGGGAFGVFAEQLIQRLPEGTIGILGEGEGAVLKMVEGKDLSDERYILRRGKEVIKGDRQNYFPVEGMVLNLPYLSSIFPEYPAYQNDNIGIQTKRGCPYDCQFCEYPYLEGRQVRYRPPVDVIADLRQHYELWGNRRFWFTDAQFITGREAYPQCTEMLERIIREGFDIEWSGYVRTSMITRDLAKLMVRSGVGDLEVSITSGSQKVINELHMGFSVEKLYEGCRYLKEAGFTGKLILNYSLNSPGDSEEGLLQSVGSYRKIAGIMGEERVFPTLFFLGVQPHTGFEQRLIDEGYLYQGYNPLSLNPLAIKKMLYNPQPLSKIIAKACLKAWDEKETSLKKSGIHSDGSHYADENLYQSVMKDSGREALLQIENIIKGK
ncbi:MAG TPA: radical SAM protein [Nitrospiria bacterium]|jgi:radical SAM superfamily enzyme YgiQ (UPF0313 family)